MHGLVLLGGRRKRRQGRGLMGGTLAGRQCHGVGMGVAMVGVGRWSLDCLGRGPVPTESASVRLMISLKEFFLVSVA